MLLTDSRIAQVVGRLEGGDFAGELATRAAASSWKSCDYGDDRDCKVLPRSRGRVVFGYLLSCNLGMQGASDNRLHHHVVAAAQADSDTAAASLLAVRPQPHSI